jgi:hypothetical protein
MAAVGVADRQQVAVEMHRALGLAGGSRVNAIKQTSSLAVSQAAKFSYPD